MIAQVLINHAQAAMRWYNMFGHIKPKVWGITTAGDVGDHFVTAEPIGHQSEVSEQAKEVLLNAMVNTVGPRYIGRVEEIWISTAPPDDRPLTTIAEEDPRVRTAIQIIGLDREERETGFLLIEPFLDDNGEQQWRQVDVDPALFTETEHALVRASRNPDFDILFNDVATAFGWTIAHIETGLLE